MFFILLTLLVSVTSARALNACRSALEPVAWPDATTCRPVHVLVIGTVEHAISPAFSSRPFAAVAVRDRCHFDGLLVSPLAAFIRAIIVIDFELVGRIDADVIASLPCSVVHIAVGAAGRDIVDVDAAVARNIAVSSVPGAGAQDVADIGLLLTLAALRRSFSASQAMAAGVWPREVEGRSARGLRAGIVGFGNIGRAFCARARVVGMLCGAIASASPPTALSELLSSSDVVLMACPLTNRTYHLLDARRIAQLRRGAVVVNVGRGALVDEHAMLKALEKRHVYHYATDVWEHEGERFAGSASSALARSEYVTALPHTGWQTLATFRQIEETVLHDVVRTLAASKQ